MGLLLMKVPDRCQVFADIHTVGFYDIFHHCENLCSTFVGGLSAASDIYIGLRPFQFHTLHCSPRAN